MPDGQLWLLHDTYTAETGWAPRHAGKELRLARLGAFDAALGAIRADAELRRRHPGHKIEPLRSAELLPDNDTERDGRPSATATRIGDLAAQHHASRQTINQRQHRMTPRKDPDWAAPDGYFALQVGAPRRDANLAPLSLEITPSSRRASSFCCRAGHRTRGGRLTTAITAPAGVGGLIRTLGVRRHSGNASHGYDPCWK